MGKTHPTYRERVGDLENNLQPFRRALRRQHKPAFDRLIGHAKDFADTGGNLNAADIRSTVLLSICLAQQIEIQELKDELAAQTDDSTDSTREQ